MNYCVLVITAALMVVASGSPQRRQPRLESGRDVKESLILKDDRRQPIGGSYSYSIETENGITQNEVSEPGANGQSNVQGSYSYVLEDGSLAEVRYVADESGFRVESPQVPRAPVAIHPVPQHALDQIRYADEQLARGLLYDERLNQWV